MNRLARALIVVPATAVLVTAGTVAVASAATGVPSGPPPSPSELNGVWCVSTTGAKACFAAYGDIVWVKDTKKNGASAAGTIKGSPAPAKWGRECFNHRGADGGWVKCNFNVPENSKGVLWAVNQPFIGNSSNTAIWTTVI